VGESLHRRRVDGAWQDTNDSGADFEVGAPQPGLVVEGEGVFGDPYLEVGTGHTTFAPLEDGGPIELVAGPQGGWHIDATLRLGGFGPDGVKVKYEAFDEQAQPISFVTHASLSTASVLEDGEGWIRVGDRVVLDIASPSEVVGTTATVRATATLGDQQWSAERVVTVVDEE